MEAFKKIKSKVVPLPLNDVDTDMIIPAQFLTSVSKDGYGENVFKRLREGDKDFPLNQQKYAGGQILVAGKNFGCGSSREHAVWAIYGGGFRVVIAKSFADIFYGNSAKNGLLLVTLPNETVEKIFKEGESGEYRVEVDLERQTLTLPDGERHSFEFDSFRKHCLLNGLDDLDYILSAEKKIADYRSKADGFCFSRVNQ